MLNELGIDSSSIAALELARPQAFSWGSQMKATGQAVDLEAIASELTMAHAAVQDLITACSSDSAVLEILNQVAKETRLLEQQSKGSDSKGSDSEGSDSEGSDSKGSASAERALPVAAGADQSRRASPAEVARANAKSTLINLGVGKKVAQILVEGIRQQQFAEIVSDIEALPAPLIELAFSTDREIPTDKRGRVKIGPIAEFLAELRELNDWARNHQVSIAGCTTLTELKTKRSAVQGATTKLDKKEALERAVSAVAGVIRGARAEISEVQAVGIAELLLKGFINGQRAFWRHGLRESNIKQNFARGKTGRADKEFNELVKLASRKDLIVRAHTRAGADTRVSWKVADSCSALRAALVKILNQFGLTEI